jgi:hypothetical protein
MAFAGERMCADPGDKNFASFVLSRVKAGLEHFIAALAFIVRPGRAF